MKINLVTTTYQNDITDSHESSASFSIDHGTEMQVVNIYPEMTYQTFDGFGGAITESAGHTFSLMSETNQQKLLEAYFGRSGNRYNFVRTHLDSCDFSVNQYAALDDPEDTEFQTFSLERDEKYILPLLREAEKTAGGKLNILLSPWSPPAFMKTNEQRTEGGSLKPKYRQFWANYICQYIQHYQLKGFPVDMLTIQNEPNATQSWDSCLYTSEQEKEFLRDYLHPALVEHGLDHVEVCIWDHNKERMFERACEIIDTETDKMVQGIAFHWYTGEHFDAIKLVQEKFPDKKLIFTEGCVEYSRFSDTGQLQKAQMYAHDIIGNINAGMHAFIDWNIILNQKGGPNHVDNFCDAPIMCDTENDSIKENLSYTYIGHFSRYIEPKAKRIASTKYTDKLEVVSMKNPDDSIVTVILNKTQEDVPMFLRVNGQVTELSIPASSIATGVIEDI